MRSTSGWRAAALGLAFAATAVPASSRAAETALRIIAVDVEGGAATLYVTPQGRSLLVDTGWPTGLPRPRVEPGQPEPPPPPVSADQIVAAAKAAGVTRIDYLMITHYHTDHIGGFHDLLARIPVGTFVDHGPNREVPPAGATPQQLTYAPVTTYAGYEAAIAGRPRVVMKAGDTLKIDDMALTAVASDGETIAEPLPGAGKPNPGCAGATSKDAIGGEENVRSLGFVVSFGAARVLAMGDTTWNVETKLACPAGKIGKIDLLLTSHHGSALSNSPPFIASLTPTVAITSNGATKGGDAESFDALRAAPGLKDVWQLHTATRSPDKNPAADLIANPGDRPDAHHAIIARVEKSGAVTVTNGRNGVSRTYPKAR